MEPEKYEPRRFDKSDPTSKWLLTADGKPRDPLAFTPFMGGKRICIGKTFAETAIRFTVPMLYHYFDFDFADPEMFTTPKQRYSIGGKHIYEVPMKLTIRNLAT